MSDGAPHPLFRAEALKWRQESWIGSVQIIEPISGRIVAYCTLALVVIVCIYTAFGTYTRRIHASGIMLPPGGLVVAESGQGGIVSQVTVHEGAHVKLGDRLFSLDVSNWSEEGATGRRSLDSLLSERSLLAARRILLMQDSPLEFSSYRAKLMALQTQRGLIKKQINRDDESLPLIERAMNEMRQAIDTHLVTEGQFQSQLFTYVQFMNSHSQTLKSLTETESQISDIKYKIDRHQYKIAEDVNDIDVRLSDIQNRIAQARGQAETVIDAPLAGTIDGISAFVGQRVAAGQPLASILPDHATLLAELYVDSRAIGFVRTGQRVLLKYAAYPYQRFGLHEGTVVEVTKAPLPARSGYAPQRNVEHSTTTERGTLSRQEGIYRIRVKPDLSYVIAYRRREDLTPGMAVEAEIAIDRRRLYQWLFYPVISIQDTLRAVSDTAHGKQRS